MHGPSAREHAGIASIDLQPSWETLRASVDAELTLAKQEFATDFLKLWLTETCPALKKHFAEQYRRVVGVHPSKHNEFKQGLERIRASGGMSVADLVASCNRRDQLNGSSSDSAGTIVGE